MLQFSQVLMSHFGIVALEGMLRRNTSCCILKILYDYNLADSMMENARKEVVQKYNWKVIAMSTLNSYKAIQKLEVKEKSNIVSIKELEEKRKETNDVKDENDITSSLLNDVTRLLKFNDRNKLFNM